MTGDAGSRAKGIEEEAFIWWQNSGTESRRSWRLLEDRLCTGETCIQTPITVSTPGLLPIPSLPQEGVIPADCEPRRVCSWLWFGRGGWGWSCACDLGGLLGLIRWPAHVPGSIKGAERGGLPHSRHTVLPRSLLTCLGDLFPPLWISALLEIPLIPVAEEWRKLCLISLSCLDWQAHFCRKPCVFNPRMSPLCGEISLKLPKANRMENKGSWL